MPKDTPRLIPTGTCWCGCGTVVSLGSFFAQGHDKIAEAALLAAKYGSSVARLLHHHGYGPDHAVTHDAVTDGNWEQCPQCFYPGAPASVATHRKKAGH